jgi:hypothetical protein
MEKRRISLLIALILLAALPLKTNSSVYNLFYGQASPLRAETPKVIFQNGTAGTSIIYMNDTSAKVCLQSPSGFAYGYVFKSSNIRVSTSSGTPIEDSEAVVEITLIANSTVLVIYNAGNMHGSTEDYRGKGCAINIDGVNVAFSWQSPYGNNHANSVTVVYATTLAAGKHIVKGMFFANSAGATVGIDTRQIVVFWFPNVQAYYVRSTVASTTTSGTPVDDPQAILTFTLDSNSIALIMYNVGNMRGSAEPTRGKGVTINIDGVDVAARQWQSPYDRNHANSVTLAYLCFLTAGSHTVKGRFFSNVAGSTTTINERQLAVFNFPASLVHYGFVQSSLSATTTSQTPVNDPQAILDINLARNSDVFAMYVGGNAHGVTETLRGKGLQLMIDDSEKVNSTSWQSPFDTNFADSVTSLWCGSIEAGSHTFRGMFFSNLAGSTVTISNRQLLVLVFPKPANYNHVLKIVNQVADTWKIRLKAFGQSNIERLSNCTIYLFNGGGVSRQICILNGMYSQQFGNQNTLTSLSTAYIAVDVLSKSTGTSFIYVYLEVLIPETSTYNLMAVTFEIS